MARGAVGWSSRIELSGRRPRSKHRDYKRIEASSRYKFSQARGSN